MQFWSDSWQVMHLANLLDVPCRKTGVSDRALSGDEAKGRQPTYQARVEGAVAIRRAVVLDVVQQPVGDFDDGLVCDVLIRPLGGDGRYVSKERRACVGGCVGGSFSLNAKLDAVEALGQLINKLLLGQRVHRMRHGDNRWTKLTEGRWRR